MMKADRWKAVEDLFHRALDIPEDQRAAFIEANSGGDEDLAREVKSLISSDTAAATGSFAAAAVKKALFNFHAVETAATSPGRKVGPYRLVKEIGRGGMGSVYLATRDDDTYEKKVAIKLVRRGMDTDFILARFRRERQILAQLEHPNIARLLDGGATDDGLPYLVMEYVQGVSISEYAQSNELSLEQRLKLFLQICDEVEYAHRNFVVHRDLKPGNILVDDKGVPKLLDFGISKLLVFDEANPSETITHDVRMLTPDYASPEQVRGDPITAGADIYSLGAVLFELLTGIKPHRIDRPTPIAVEKAVCEIDIQRPSDAAREIGRTALSRKLQGDLDNILLLAMRKEAKRRYASVHDLASDIRRYLDHLPVSARPDSFDYRTRKFLRRNWGPLTAVAAVILVLLIGVLMAQHEARIARRHFQQVRSLANTFVTSVHDEIRNLPGSTRARRMIVNTGLQYLQTLAANSQGDLDLQRELGAGYMRIGDVQGGVLEANLGDPKGALESYGKALNLLEPIAQQRPEAYDVQVEILNVHRRIGDVYGYTKSSDDALRSYAHARAVGETLLAKRPDDDALRRSVADLCQAQGRTLRTTEDLDGAINASNRALDLYRISFEKAPEDLTLRREIANAVSAAGMALARRGKRSQALQSYHEAVGHFEYLAKHGGQNSTAKRGLMLAYSHVGDLLHEPGVATPAEAASALDWYLKMYDIAQQLYRADPANYRGLTDIGIATMRVANATTLPEERLHRYAEALGYLRKAAQTSKDLMVDMNTAFIETRMGDILSARRDHQEAARYYREAIPLGERILGVDPKNSSARRTLMDGVRRLGEDAARRGGAVEAQQMKDKLLRLAQELKDDAGAPVRVQALIPRAHLGIASISAIQHDAKSAREWYERSIAGYRRLKDVPGFSSNPEIQEAETALAKLR
jgi:serine/threonine protein kinase/tetratricopeptide (TPR) repeat protein